MEVPRKRLCRKPSDVGKQHPQEFQDKPNLVLPKAFPFFLILITCNRAFSFVHSHTPTPRSHYNFTLVVHPFLHCEEIISSSLVCGLDHVRACPACAPAWEEQMVRSSMKLPQV